MASSDPHARVPSARSPAPASAPGLQLVFLLALLAPAMLAWNVPPSSTLLNQALALLGWAAVLIVIAMQLGAGQPSPDRARAPGAAWGVPLVLLIVGAAALLAPFRRGLPWSLALSGAGLCAAALAAWAGGAACRGGPLRLAAFRAFCWALLAAGVGSFVVGCVQFFEPQWTDGDWIARTSFIGRAVGNLRQPNHLSTLLLWSAAAAWWLGLAGAVPRALAGLLYGLMIAGVVMTASRTGMVGVLLFGVWGLFERRARWPGRWLLMAAPLIYAGVWWGLAGWAHASGHVFGAEGRVTADGDLSSSRFAIWSNTLALIAREPLEGVGFGRFNFAWTLTPFADRPTAFFDHTHNLPLQFAVELGLPLAALIVGLLGWALLAAGQLSLRRVGEDEAEGHAARVGFMMVLLIALHSLLEYPLWYAHFLLPTAWLFGWLLAVGRGRRSAIARPVADGRSPLAVQVSSALLALAGLGLLVGSVALLHDYRRVVAIFAPPAGGPPLEERIAEGRRSWFFAHHASYAAATTAPHPGAVIQDFGRATFYLLDTRLMVAWARAMAERGDVDRARHLAARLREFRNPQSDDFFAPCGRAAPAPSTRPPDAGTPFQCEAPKAAYDDRDFP